MTFRSPTPLENDWNNLSAYLPLDAAKKEQQASANRRSTTLKCVQRDTKVSIRKHSNCLRKQNQWKCNSKPTMGSSSKWQASSRLLGRPRSANAVKLPRAYSHPSRLKSFRARLKGQNRSSVIRQHCCCCLHQPSGWAQPKSRSPCLSSVGYRVRNGHTAHCEASGGKGKPTCPPTVLSIAPLRISASSTPFQRLRSLLGTPFSRPFRKYHKH